MKSCWVICVVLCGDVYDIGSRLVSLNVTSIIFQFQRIASQCCHHSKTHEKFWTVKAAEWGPALRLV